MTMLELYGMGSPNVMKIVLMLEEIGLAYRVKRINVMAGEQHSETFLRLNPNGKVPVLIDYDSLSDPEIIIESGAILIYLAEKTGLFLPSEARSRSRVLQWLMLQMSSIGPVFGQAIHFSAVIKSEDYGRQRFCREKDRLLDLLERQFAVSAFVAGSNYSIADIAIFPWIRTLKRFSLTKIAALPNLDRWFETIRQRPALPRAESVVDGLSDLDRKDFAAATSQQLDRYFGRI